MDNLLSIFLAVAVQGQVDPAHKDTLVLYHQTQPQFQSLGLKNQDTGDLGGDRQVPPLLFPSLLLFSLLYYLHYPVVSIMLICVYGLTMQNHSVPSWPYDLQLLCAEILFASSRMRKQKSNGKRSKGTDCLNCSRQRLQSSPSQSNPLKVLF